MQKVVMTITGPSASGKTELVKRLVSGGAFTKLVSVTTRDKRPGEVEGEDYYFISKEEFDSLLEADQLVQYVIFNGKGYATTRQELARVFELGKTPVIIVEPSGIPHFKNLEVPMGFVVYSIFITAPEELLKERFMNRIGGKLSTLHDDIRFEAIKREVSEWRNTHSWDCVLNNLSSDLEDITWFCKELYDQVQELSEVVIA